MLTLYSQLRSTELISRHLSCILKLANANGTRQSEDDLLIVKPFCHSLRLFLILVNL